MKLLKTISNILGVLFIIIHLTNASAADYFVNDNSTTNDIFCTAIGNNANNGTSASTPKATLTAVWNTYGPAGTNVISSGDNIYIDAGLYFQTDANLVLSVNGISIIGAGSDFTIFDNNQSSVDANKWATITGDNITISDVYLTGYNYGFGGANVIAINGALNLTFNNVMINENNPGGGSSSVVITGASTVTFNGGGSNCNPGSASVAGGGVNIEGNGNVVSFNNYTLSANEKDFQGGSGLYIRGNNTTLVTITNSIFSNNINGSNEGGGGIFIADGAQLTVSNSCFNNNESSQTSSTNYGGAISVGRGSTITVNDCSFNNNIATSSGNGGAIGVYTSFGSTGSTATANISNCSFTNNVAADGSDILSKVSFSRPAIINVSECTFSGTSQDITVESGGTINVSNSGNPSRSAGVTMTNTIAASLTPSTSCPSVIDPCFSVLPVEFIDFTADCKNNKTLFEWSTATELNNDYFILEQSRDLISFEKIAKIQGNGTTQNTTQYKLPIETEDNGVYYRLKQVDIDGRINELKTIAFEQNCSEDIVSNVFFNTSGNIEFTYNSTQRNTLTVDLINTTGAQIHSEPIDTYQHESHYQFGHFKSLPSGVYFIRFMKKDGAVQHAKIYHP